MSGSELQQVLFLKLGGTWDMVKNSGKLIGSGELDDDSLYLLEKSLGYYKKGKKDLSALEFQLAKSIEKIIAKSSQNNINLIERLGWVPNIKKHITGKFMPLYSGDSSHLRPALIAPLVSFMLKQANINPSTQILGAQGTDTADIALLPLLDAYLFDTELLPIFMTGSNRSTKEWNSDAPKNFSDLIKLAGANLPSGAYWVFAGHLYKACDFVKIDPLESRRIENYSTFFAPRLTTRYTKKVIAENSMFHSAVGTVAPKNHVSKMVNTENLYSALTQVEILDLSNQNSTASEVEQILNKNCRGVVVSAHSLGNASNPIREACAQAALNGKLVTIVSRSLIGEVNERYAACLLGINGKELIGTGKHIISGHKLNKNIAKALMVRAIQENLDQKKTQILINSYCDSRGLLT